MGHTSHLEESPVTVGGESKNRRSTRYLSWSSIPAVEMAWTEVNWMQG